MPHKSPPLARSILMTPCIRCGTPLPKAGPYAAPQVCGNCWSLEYDRTDCARCGNPKLRAQKPHSRPIVLCADCYRLFRMEKDREMRKAHAEQRRGEVIQREHAEAPDEVSADPLGTFHLGQTVHSKATHLDQEEGPLTPPYMRRKVRRWDGQTVEVIDDGETVRPAEGATA